MFRLESPIRRAVALVLAGILLAIAGWNAFGPGEMSSGSVSAVIGDWEPDPNGVDAAIARLGTTGQAAVEQRLSMQAHIAENLANGATLSITSDAVTTTVAGVSKTVTCQLRAQPAYHIETYDPAQPHAVGTYFRTTSRGLIWWIGANPIPMRIAH